MGSREQFQHLDPSGGFQLSASCQMSPGYNPLQVEVSLQTASFPSAPQFQDGASGLTEEPPIYVNAKQFKRILHRRAVRERLKHKDIRTRKPYMHESRHKHAATRPRGPGGRFLTREELGNLKTSSQEKVDGFEPRVPPNSLGEHRFAMKESLKITKDMTMSFYGPEELEDLRKKYSSKRP